MKNESIWLNDIKFEEPKNINNDLDVDVLIIGGGMTGLSCAYHLKDSNLKVCLVDKDLIGHGVSARTTGKLTYLQDNIYSKLKDKAIFYYKSQKEAIELVINIIKDNDINCDLQQVDSYIYATNDSEINIIKKEQNALKKMGVNYKHHSKLPNNCYCKYGISVSDTYVFHPIKYLVSLKKIIEETIPIYENSCVTSISKDKDIYICKVNNYNIKCKKIVIASHYPFFIFPYVFPIKTYIERSYISASMVNDNKSFSAITVSKKVKSMRYHKKYFIYLNGSHNLCNKYNYKDNFNNLLKELKEFNINPNFIWSNQDVMTIDNLPFIGYIDESLLIGTGYNTWGMTNGSLAGKILSDLIQNKKNKYSKLFDPKRNKELNIIKYPLLISYSVKSLVENKIIKNKSWYNNKVIFKKINGKDVGIYIDDNNNKHIVYNLCPHFKCSLVFNEEEKTWDCPCHGSRFDIDGNCIFGPSKDNIRYNN